MRLKALGIAALLLCILSNITYAGTPEPLVCSNPNSLGAIPATNTGIGLALLALTISFDVIAIAYAVSKLFPHTGLRNWLQQEYWEVAKSAIIIVCIYSAITFVGNIAYLIAPSVVTSGGSTGGFADITPLLRGAEVYLCQVNANMINVWSLVGILSGGTGFWSALQVGFYIPVPVGPFLTLYDGVSFLPFSNWMLQTGNYLIAPYGSIINDLVNFLLFPFTATTIALITLLPSLAYIGLTFFIPMGLVFRALPFIRGIGGTLIAIGVALCLVLPATFVLFNYQATALLSAALPIIQPAPPVLGGLSCNLGSSIIGTIVCAIATPIADSVSSAGNLAYSIWYTLPVFSTTGMYFFMNNIMKYGLYVIIQMFLFAVDLMIMYPLVDAIARAMGGSIRLRLGGKLRLAS